MIIYSLDISCGILRCPIPSIILFDLLHDFIISHCPRTVIGTNVEMEMQLWASVHFLIQVHFQNKIQFAW